MQLLIDSWLSNLRNKIVKIFILGYSFSDLFIAVEPTDENLLDQKNWLRASFYYFKY